MGTDECEAFLEGTFGAQFDAFSALCLDTAFSVETPCDPAYEVSGRADVRAACANSPQDANGFPTGECSSRCMPVFEQYFARCTNAVKQSGYTSQQYQTFAASCHENAAAHDDCSSAPCQNGADCQSDFDNGGYSCSCAPGYEGANCEHAVEACRAGTLETAQWRGDYFSRPDLDEGGSRRPHHSMCEDTMPSYQWGDGAPDRMPKSSDNFSVRWTSDVTIAGGTYEITVGSDDGSRVLIDGIVVLDHWQECCSTWSTRVTLTEGPHQIVYEYRELGGGANAAFDIAFVTHGIIQVTPAQIETGQPLRGEIDVAGSHQQYRFSTVAGTTYSVDARATGIPGMAVTLYASDDVTVLASGNNFEWTSDGSGSNLVQVEGSSPTDTGSYSLTIASSGGPCSPGGERIDATDAGQILFYDVPHAAENDVACEWHLFCGEGQTVNVEFGRFDTEEGYDFVNVYDGISTANALLGSFSGVTAPSAQRSSGVTMLMTFATDGSVLGHGFDATFSCTGEGVAAVELTPGPPARMTLGPGEIGVYIFEGEAGTTYIISLRPTPGQGADITGTPSFRLLDENQQQLDQVIVSSDSGILTFTCPTSGAYRIVVSGGDGDGGNFMLSYVEADDGCAAGGTNVFPTHDGVIDRSTLAVGAACSWTITCLPGENVALDLQDSQGFVAISDAGTMLDVPATGLVSSTGEVVTLIATATAPRQRLKVSHGCRGGEILTIEVGTGPRVSEIERSPGPPGMEKQFQFTAVGGTTYQLETDLLGLPDSVMTLYDTDAMTVLAENDDNPLASNSLSSYIEWTCPADGTYVVGVHGFNPTQEGEFSLSITAATASGSPCVDGFDLPAPSGAIDFYFGTGTGDNCNWHLDCGAGQIATVAFTALDTEANFDFVWIFDGDSHDDAVIAQLDGDLGSPCTGELCGPYSSTGPRVTVAFTSDESVSASGFRATYLCSSATGDGTGGGGSFQGPQVPTDGTPVEAAIEHPGDQIYFTFLGSYLETYRIETELDGLPDTVVTLLVGETELATARGSPITYTCNAPGTYTILVRAFDAVSQTGGFRLMVTAAGAAEDPCGGGVVLTESSGLIDYFAGHPDDVTCTWTTTCAFGSNPTLTFTQLDTEANFDFVNVYDTTPGNIAEGSVPAFQASGTMGDLPTTVYTSTTTTVTLEFTADGSVTGQGFVAEYMCEEDAQLPAITFGVPETGTFGGGTSQYSYSVSATIGHAYTIITESTADLVVTIYAPDGETQLFQNSGGNIEWICGLTRNYIIDVAVTHLAFGPPPSFTLTVTDPGTSHCYTDAACMEPDEEHSTACLMAGTTPLVVPYQEGDITMIVPSWSGRRGTNTGLFPDATACAWQFSCPEGQHVLVEATRMDLEPCCDWVDVYDSDEIPEYEADIYASESAADTLFHVDGDTGTGTMSGSSYTGSRFESTGPVMSMAFHADQNYMLSGFDVHYSCVEGPSVDSCGVGEWLEEFWGSSTPDGEPLYAACIGQDGIDYDWGGGGPDQLGGDVTDNFSARWTGTVMLYDPADGTRQQDVDVVFAAGSDDGSRIYIDGEIVLDHWGQCCTTWYTDVLTLSAGPHNVVYEMRENGGGAYAHLTWEIMTPAVVPDCPQGQWTALYWSNPNMDGEPDAADCVDGEVNFNYDEMGGGPLQLPNIVDNFSVRWSATVQLASGQYIFHSHSDDGSRVTVNGDVVLDHW